MKKFLFLSVTAHGLLFGGLIFLGTLLAHPPMSYYSVDLLTSLPSGSTPAPAAPAPTPVSPQVKEPIPAPPPRTAPREAIKVVDKTPKRPPLPHPAPPKPTVKPSVKKPALPSWAVANNVESTGNSSPSPLGSNAAAVSAKAGQPFPFPWYLKAVSDRLDKQWHAPEESQEGTSCQISFVIVRSGAVSNIRVSTASGDPFFDQVALRAVANAGTMPPLPSGFPEPQLHVHMTFERAKI